MRIAISMVVGLVGAWIAYSTLSRTGRERQFRHIVYRDASAFCPHLRALTVNQVYALYWMCESCVFHGGDWSKNWGATEEPQKPTARAAHRPIDRDRMQKVLGELRGFTGRTSPEKMRATADRMLQEIWYYDEFADSMKRR